MEQQFSEIEQEIIVCLKQITIEANAAKEVDIKNRWGDGKWTNTIIEKLAEIGDRNNTVCPCEDSGEWLYDLTWYKEDANGNLEYLVLAMESEWNRSRSYIKYDFEKLLVCNSRLKLMICQTNKNDLEDLFGYFEKSISTYKLGDVGERFLIAIFDDYETEGFVFKVIERK